MNIQGNGEIKLPQAHGSIFILVGVVLVSASADILLIAAGLQNLAPLPILLALHVGIAPFIWLATRNCDPTLSAMAVIANLAMGPVGALGTLLLSASLAGSKSSASSLADWHSKLAKPSQVDLAQQLSQAIKEGRLLEPGAVSPASFQEVSQYGSVAQRQTMLGLVSQRFDPGFSAILRQELRSEEAAVRVSAAAVFSRLRDKNRLQMGAGKPLPDVLTPKDAQERGIALARGVKSGLLDPADLTAARIQSLDLLQRARPRATEADELEEVICTLLFEAGHHQALQERLAAIDTGQSAVLRSLHARLLMKAGRMAEAAEVIRRPQGNSVRLNLSRRAEGDHALLSLGHGDGQ